MAKENSDPFVLIQWLCVESLLSVMHILDARRIPGDRTSFFSDDTVESIFHDIVERWDGVINLIRFYFRRGHYLKKNIILLPFSSRYGIFSFL